jgi:hypothetical protein
MNVPNRLSSSATAEAVEPVSRGSDTSSGPRAGDHAKAYWPAFIAIWALLCLPVATVTYVPLVDYPNHLARCYVLYHYHESLRYQALFKLAYEPVPNVAVDAVIVPLLALTPALTAAKLFLVFVISVYAAGCHLLSRTLYGRRTFLALAAMPTVYSSMFLEGFVNYVLGLGLFLTAFACWLEWRRQWSFSRMGMMIGLVAAAYLAHLSAYAFLGFACLVVWLWDYAAPPRNLSKKLLDLIPLAPPVLAFIAFMHGTGHVGALVWNTISGKVIGFMPLFLTYQLQFDAFFCLAILLLAMLAWKTSRSLTIVWPVWTIGCFFFLFYLLCPLELFTSSAADARFISPAILLLLFSFQLKVPRRTAVALLLAIVALCLIRVGVIWHTWNTMQPELRKTVRLLNTLPPGASVYPAWFSRGKEEFVSSETAHASTSRFIAKVESIYTRSMEERSTKTERVFFHTPLYAVITRQAYVPSLFAIRGQQPLVWRTPPDYRQPDATGRNAERWMKLLGDYEYVWTYAAPPSIKQELNAIAIPVGVADNSVLWKLKASPPQAH